MSKLIATTIVPARPMDGGESFRTFGPDDGDVPEWAAKQMGAHLFEDGQHPYPDSNCPGKDTDSSARAGAHREAGAIPPKGGPGSGTAAWAAYASEVGVAVEEDASREDIIAAIEKAGKPTEYQD